jgi:hypothetical protein
VKARFLRRKVSKGKKLNIFKQLFGNKAFCIFVAIFITGNITLYNTTYNDQMSLALNDKIFDNTIDLTTAYPENLLSDKFNNEPHISTTAYGNYLLLFFSLIIGTELFAIASIFFSRRSFLKRYLLFYGMGMQLLILIPILVITFTPARVIDDLNKQAEADIKRQVNLLLSIDGHKQLSIKSTPVEIKNTIIKSNTPPEIIDEQPDGQAIIQSFEIESKDTLYRIVILPIQILARQDWNLHFEAYLFPSNVLVIKKTSRNLLSQTLPIISKKIIEIELGKYVRGKKDPRFGVLSDDAYNIIQTQKSEKIKADFLGYISEIKSYLADANKYIPILQSDKKSLEEEKISYKVRTDGILSECRAGYSVEDCKPVEDVINKNTASIENNLKIVNDKLQGWLNIRPELTYALQVTQASYEKFLKFPITSELQAGVFNPPDTIYLKYFSEGQNLPSPTGYVENGIHEYLHYQSYNQSVFLPNFISEGITEYLANRLVKKYSLRQNITVTYPEEVFIIQELIKTIPEDKLLTIYFNQSELELQKLIDSYYGSGTYEKLRTKGEVLTYTDPADLQSKEKIKEEIIDLLSAFSKH